GRPVLGVDRQELDLVRVVEDRRRDRAAFIDVEPPPNPLAVRQPKSRQPGVGAADQLAARLDLIERARMGGESGRGKRRPGKASNVRSHDKLLSDANGSGRSPDTME